MPQDTIWLNPERTAYLLPSDSANSVDTSYTSGYKTDFQKKSDFYSGLAFPCTIVLLAAIWIIIRIRDGRSHGYVELGGKGRSFDDNGNEIIEPEDTANEERVDSIEAQQASQEEACLTYEGDQLNFSTAELTAALNKRSTYFKRLNPFEKEKFISRLKKFISQKTFKIHDNSGFKEMPMLISGAAIQVSFGLDNYLLPDFPFINVYPAEFLFVEPTMRFLEGNVSGNCINIAWKYFLEGFAVPDDGQNVGLHEMSHAYYFQNLQCNTCEDEKFKTAYATFELNGDKVFEEEKEKRKDLYSDYALKNFQEFWAESVEVFFEKPVKLKSYYPELYDTMRNLLNQDTARYQL